jgi:hypothetical protein
MAVIPRLQALDTVAFSVGLVVILLGLVISWRAYQGSRRNESRPMFLLAIGMMLITVIPTLTELVVIPWFVARYMSPGTGTVSLTLTVSRLCEAVGISVLIYSLRSRPSG